MSRARERPSRHAAFLALSLALAPVTAVAQATAPVALRAARRDTIAIDAASAVTVVFSLRNQSGSAVDVAPKLVLPRGWSMLAAPATITLGPNASDTWLVGVALPGGAAAGFYAIRAALPDTAETDSVIVHVVERRAIDAIAADAPSFAAAGDVYSLRFTVRNRGNVADTVTIAATSSAGSRIDLDASSAALAPGEAKSVVARVGSPIARRGAVEDVVELIVSDRSSSDVHASASSNVLIVARTNGHAMLATVPAELTVRGARAGTGVAPLALTGAGPIAPGSTTTMDFAFRLPAGEATVFGERDEYRLDVATPKYAMRLGDGSHAFSALSGSGYTGFGGEVERTGDQWNSGAYITKDRWTPNGSTEAAVLARRKFAGDNTSLSTVFVGRSGAVGIAALEGRAQLARNTVLDVEASKSDSAGVVGFAHRAQLIGQTGWMTYDAGWLRAEPAFAGATRGNEYRHASMNAHPGGPVAFAITEGDYAATSLTGTDVSDRSRSRSTLFEATTDDGASLSYERLVQDANGTTSFKSVQHSVRVRGHQRLGRFDLRGGLGHHILTTSAISKRSFESFDAGIHSDVGRRGGVDVYAERSSGGAIEGVQAPGVVFGASTTLRLPFGLSFYSNGSTTLGRNLGVTSLSQADFTLSKPLRNGMTAALRQHVAIMPNGARPDGLNGLYLELRTPLAIPTMPLRSPGRVNGRVVDASTGRGLPDVLVRVGKQAAISDADGRVALSGLQSGKYSVNVESADRSRGGVTLGDATVEVSERSDTPSRFAAALAVGARVRASVRRSEFAVRTINATGDSLVDVSGIDNVVVALMGVRDTIYQTTDGDGKIDFGVIAPGPWTAKVLGEDLPAFHAFDREAYSLVIRGGDERELDFKLLPKHRAITVLASDEPQVLAAPTPNVEHGENTVVAHEPLPMPVRHVAPRRLPSTSHSNARRSLHVERVAEHETPVKLQGEARPIVHRPPIADSHQPRTSWWWIVVVLVCLGFVVRKLRTTKP